MANKHKILLIDDDRDQIDMYRFKFEKEGFVFISAQNGAEGTAIAQAEKPDIILLDLILVNEKGVEVLKGLKTHKLTSGIPVIVLTNLAKKEMKLQSEQLGAADFIVKTQITPAELVQRINTVLK